MNILVTGGAGFIGCNLVRALVEKGDLRVTVMDDLYTGRKDNLADIMGNIEFIEASTVNYPILREAIIDKDIVFHLAARNIIASTEAPEMDLEVNTRGTLNILTACREVGSIQKIVYTSTSSVYGNPRYVPINEDDPVTFLNFYSVSKFAGEGYCNVFYELFDLPTVVVRYSNVYGFHQIPESPYCGVIGKFIMWALRNEPILIHGDGEQTRDFTFVEDAVEATITAALNPKSTGRTYNIGTGREVSVNELARMVVDIAGSSSIIQSVENRHVDNIRRRVLNVERLRRDLKYVPRYTLERGIERTIQWFKENVEI
jgi:UDP-glucose 4-epimerase